MKKLFLLCVTFLSLDYAAFAQEKGDIWVGGNSDLNLSITPEFAVHANVTGDYFLTGKLSLGAQVGLGLGAMTEVSLAPRVQYFVTKNIYAMLNADMLSVAGEDVTLGLNSLNAGVGYWYALNDHVVLTPMLNLNNLTDELAIGLSAGVTFKL